MESLQDIYNSLGDIYEVSEIIASRPNILPALANLLVKHNLDKDGAAIPYEFTYTTNNPPPEPSSEFLESWCSILRAEGVEGLLGLSIRDNSVPAIAHEVSDPESRVNRLVFGDDAAEGTSVIATTWRFLNFCRCCRDQGMHIL
ncbi:hypothetical protein FOIG_07812 [Fusarium odoratissimum NRRL 54006]|uniref:Uncharacterized protein n=1 Tax=Fusarium odoratissimum (strain NRRL 54006) TaxID=1089451 RepID=X0JWW4_FUSO5|nr:uncharacterized protein FOIG_07812 [Fusarium odoratissimum NRRL 54006]EXM00957.1 hypothetical protein FOIG_07812 [Fusarium odoratissimum NRRL 54006]